MTSRPSFRSRVAAWWRWVLCVPSLWQVVVALRRDMARLMVLACLKGREAEILHGPEPVDAEGWTAQARALDTVRAEYRTCLIDLTRWKGDEEEMLCDERMARRIGIVPDDEPWLRWMTIGAGVLWVAGLGLYLWLSGGGS